MKKKISKPAPGKRFTLENLDPYLVLVTIQSAKGYVSTATPMLIGRVCSVLRHPSLLVGKATPPTFGLNLFCLLSFQPRGVVVVATVVLILPRDIRHHPLKTGRVALLVELVAKISVNHFMDKGSLYLGNIIIHIPKKLFGQVNLHGAKLSSTSPVSTVTRRGSHSGIPDYGDIGNLTIEMRFIQLDKHFFDIRPKHDVSLVTLSYNR